MQKPAKKAKVCLALTKIQNQKLYMLFSNFDGVIFYHGIVFWTKRNFDKRLRHDALGKESYRFEKIKIFRHYINY